MEMILENGKAFAIQVLVANELELTKRGVDYAKLFLKGKLFPMQFSQLELAANDAVENIQKANKIKEAEQLAEKYLGGYRPE